MKKGLLVVMTLMLALFAAGCGGEGKPEAPEAATMTAVILEVGEGTFLVEPVEGSMELNSADRITVPMEHMEPSPEPMVGDTIEITYDGTIMETYPGRIANVSAIKVVKEAEVISFHGKEYRREDLSDRTLEWLALSPEEKVFSSYQPPEFVEEYVPKDWGLTLTAENVTPTGMTLVIAQSGGEPTGELNFGSDYWLEKLEGELSVAVPYVVEGDVAWTSEAYMVPMDGSTEQQIKWEFLYGSLPAGTYRLSKEFMDFRGPGDYDKQTCCVDFEVK